MALPRYQILLISITDGSTLAVLDSQSFWDLRYSRVLNGVGRIALTLPGNNPYRTLFTLDNMIEVYRTDPTSATGQLLLEDTYLIRINHRFREENDERFVAGGVSLNQILERRLVDPADDPGAAGGYSTKAGAADTVMVSYIDQQAGPSASALRRTPNLTINPVGGVGAAIGRRLRFENLLEQIQDMAARGKVDFVITRNGLNNFLVTVAPLGLNKTKTANYPFSQWVGLDPRRGNLQRPSLQLDRTEEKNFVYCLGEGQATARQLQMLQGDTATDTPVNRIEFTSDARRTDKQDVQTLLTAARIALYDNLPKMEFAYEPTGLEPGNVYRQDIDIGDRITVQWDEYSSDLRFTEVEIDISGDGGETIKTTMARYDQ